MRPEVKLLQQVHEAGGCDATEIFGVGLDDVEAESDEIEADNLINHPSYYCDGGIETLDFILAKKLDFLTGQVCKYISRAGKKDPDKDIEDLKKARFYLDRKIKELEKARRA